MITVGLAYPVPLDSPEVLQIFLPAIQRFCDSYRQHPPGYACIVHAICCNADAPQSVQDAFGNIPVVFHRYDGSGADLGAQQWLSRQLDPEVFQVNLTSRVYFHRSGWLKRLAEHRKLFGPNLYGTSVSREGGRLHLCTRCFAADAGQFAAYPHEIRSRDQGVFYEVGDGNPDGSLAEWFERTCQRQPHVVYWDHAFPWRQRHYDDMAVFENTFRRGNQSQLLVWDKHSKIYEEASESEKARLRAICQGESESALGASQAGFLEGPGGCGREAANPVSHLHAAQMVDQGGAEGSPGISAAGNTD